MTAKPLLFIADSAGMVIRGAVIWEIRVHMRVLLGTIAHHGNADVENVPNRLGIPVAIVEAECADATRGAP